MRIAVLSGWKLPAKEETPAPGEKLLTSLHNLIIFTKGLLILVGSFRKNYSTHEQKGTIIWLPFPAELPYPEVLEGTKKAGIQGPSMGSGPNARQEWCHIVPKAGKTVCLRQGQTLLPWEWGSMTQVAGRSCLLFCQKRYFCKTLSPMRSNPEKFRTAQMTSGLPGTVFACAHFRPQHGKTALQTGSEPLPASWSCNSLSVGKRTFP